MLKPKFHAQQTLFFDIFTWMHGSIYTYLHHEQKTICKNLAQPSTPAYHHHPKRISLAYLEKQVKLGYTTLLT